MQFARLLQLNMPGKSARKRMLSGLLVFALLLQFVILPSAVKSHAATTASSNGVLDIDSTASVSHSETLTDNGDGTYTYTMDLYIPGAFDDESMSETVARNGYFTASHEGDFLVEIWGGDGADGGVTNYSYNDTAAPGGKGGYLYGVVHLKRGETLFYTLGGNGQQTDSTTAGGGVNGDGGAHGDLGSVKVGGGGGYSAVFKFGVDDKFAETYLDADGNIALEGILESDRLNKYIMIAGGGGGGGGGNGIIGGTARALPYGGVGGNMDSASTTISGGTVYFGQDGGSSGTSFDYVGHGATQNPGVIADTWIGRGWFEGKQPNDWTGSLNSAYTGGAGGAGNFRGGAGGGGYAGGSGGVQTELIVASNVGGGGGGSSYMASGLATDKKGLPLLGADKNPSDHGGAVVITCLGHEEEDEDTFMFSVSGDVSDYFTIVNSTTTVGGEPKTDTVAEDGKSFKLSGNVHQKGGFRIELVLKPKDGFAGGNNVPLFKSFKFNETKTLEVDESCTHANVPLQMEAIGNSYSSTTTPFTKETSALYTDKVSGITVGEGNYKYIEKIGTIDDQGNDDASDDERIVYVVYNAAGNEITDASVSVTETTKYKVAYTVTLKDTGYAKVGDPVGELKTMDGQKKRVQEVSAYAVLVVNELVGGESGGEITLGEMDLKYAKNLVYNNNGTYTLSLNVLGSADGMVEHVTKTQEDTQTTTSTPDIKDSYSKNITYAANKNSATAKFEVPISGYYYIQAWGGDGGNGGISSDKTDRPLGGYGAYLDGYVYLQEGYILDIELGKSGTQGADNQEGTRGSVIKVDISYGVGGTGGGATTVTLKKNASDTGEYLMIAAGGGGAGGNWSDWRNKHSGIGTHDSNIGNYGKLNGYNIEGKVNWNTQGISDSVPSTIDGAQGNDGYENELTNAPPGVAGTSYAKSNIGQNKDATFTFTATDKIPTKRFLNYRSEDGTGDNSKTKYAAIDYGAVYITCLQAEPVTTTTTVTKEVTEKGDVDAGLAALHQKLSGFDLISKLSQYFVIDSISGINNVDSSALTINSIDATEVSAKNIVPKFADTQTTDETTKDTTIKSAVDFTVNFVIKPKDGFLGGNNVPVLVYKDASNTGMTLQQGTNTIAIKQQDTTDFANVAIPAVDASGLKLENPTYVLGTGAMKIEKGTMYSWDNKQDDEDWMHAFVDFTGPTHDESFTPKVDDPNYEITVGIKPKHTGTAVKAVVVPEVSGNSVTKTGSVNIINQIHYNLTNMTTTHVEETVDGYVDEHGNPKKFHLHPLSTNYATILKPETGYLLRPTITVMRGGTKLTAGTDYVYYSDTGEVLVYAAAINNEPITIIAEGRVQTYDIYFISVDEPTLNKTFTYESGKVPTDALTYYNTAVESNKEGHSFVWEWDGEVPSVMPAGNQWVFGAYVPNDYPLTIHYDAPGYTKPLDDVTLQIPYGSDFSVPSPVLENYRLTKDSPEIVTGTMVNTDKQTVIPHGLSFTVKYEPIPEGNVDINYVFTDGSPAKTETKTESETNPGEKLTPNGHYEFTLTPQTGYTIFSKEKEDEGEVPDDNKITTVSVTMDNDANGQQITVYCRPDRYQLSFNTDGGNTIKPVYIQYNQPYGNYASTVDGTLTYQQLPTPTRNGYKFLGWYLGETQIKPETMVDTVGDRELKAKWEMITYKVTVRYYCPYPTEHELGTYSTTLPSYKDDLLNSYTLENAAKLATDNGILFDGVSMYDSTHNKTADGFTLTADKTTVKMDANQVINVQVVYGPKKLTIYYVDANGTEMKPTYTQDELFAHQEYRVESPKVDGYVANTPVVEGSMGMEDKLVTVLYRDSSAAANTKVKVTVTWGDLNFKYDYGTWNPEKHIYENGSFTPNTDGGNTVIVNNADAPESNIYVYAELSYEARNNTPYPDTNVYFTEDSSASGTRTNGMNVNTEKGLAPGGNYVAYIWTEGTMPVSARNNTDPITLGKCNVTIRAGKDYTP